MVKMQAPHSLGGGMPSAGSLPIPGYGGGSGRMGSAGLAIPPPQHIPTKLRGHNPRCWHQRSQSVPLPLYKNPIQVLEPNFGPGHCNKYQTLETTPCLVRFHERKGVEAVRGRDLWRTFTNPYQFDKSHVGRVDNYLQRADSEMENTKLVKGGLPTVPTVHSHLTTMGQQKPIDKYGDCAWTMPKGAMPDGGPCENWTGRSTISTRSHSYNGRDAGYFGVDSYGDDRYASSTGRSYRASARDRSSYKYNDGDEYNGYNNPYNMHGNARGDYYNGNGPPGINGMSARSSDNSNLISARSYHSAPERPYSIRQAQSYEFTNKPPIIHKRSPSGVRKSSYQNTVVELKRDLPGYMGYVPATTAENVLGKTWRNIIQRSAQMRGENGVAYDGVHGYIEKPDPFPSNKYPRGLVPIKTNGL